MEFDFDKAFKYPMTFLKLNRLHPAVARDKKWALEFFLMHGVYTGLFLLLLNSTIFHELKNHNIYQACANIIILVVYFMVSIDYFIMVWYQDVLMSLINTMKEDYEVAKTLPPEEQIFVEKCIRTGILVAKLWLAIAVSAANFFPVQAITLMIYYAVIGDFKLVTAFEIKYPGIMEETKYDLIPFVIMFLIMTFYEVYSMCIFGGVVPLGPIFLIHACGQLAIVEHRIYKIFPQNGYNTETTIRNLVVCIEHLQKIYR